MLPELPIRVQPTAARLHYLTPPDPAAYSFPRLPPFFVMDTHFYGFPVHWRGCVKVADDTTGAPFDPDREREHDDPAALAKLRDFLRRHMPDLSEAEVVYSKTCTYAMTPDTDFVIDYLPKSSQRDRRGGILRTRVQVWHSHRSNPGGSGHARHDALGPQPLSSGPLAGGHGRALVARRPPGEDQSVRPRIEYGAGSELVEGVG